MNDSTRQSREFFETRYREADDPWDFASSTYELDRYHATLGALSKARYKRAYEPGCSVGVLTQALAGRCEAVVACDISQVAAERARDRCRRFPNVSISQGDAAEFSPSGAFDLVVFSEIGYYFAIPRLKELAQDLVSRMEPGGEFVAVHWLGHSADHVLHGDEVHDALKATLPSGWMGGSRHAGFRIDSWQRPS